MALPLISQSGLRGLARRDDVELRVGRDQDLRKELQTREGSWGGRLIRNLTSLFGSPKTEGYSEAKSEVLQTLKSMYGEEIGTKVFRANIGEMENGLHFSSRAHPITGRHIKQMIEQGDRELLRKYGAPQNGGVSFGRTGLKTEDGEPVPSERSTEDWMLRKSAGMPGPTRDDPPYLDGSFDRRGMDLRSELVGPGHGHREVQGEPIARLLLEDFDRRPGLGPQDKGHAWTLDIDLPNGNRHQIGLRVDPQDPGKVNVFDVRRGEYGVSREDLGTWLDAHLKENYSVEGLQLHRSEETMLDERFVKRGNDHVFERRYNVRDQVSNDMREYFDSEANKPKVPFGGGDPPFEIAPQFKTDLHRSDIQITQQGSSSVLDTENWETQLTRLVGECSDEELRNGVFNLTAMLNQSLGNSIAGVGILNSLEDMGLPPLTAASFMQQVKLEKDETTGMIRIDVLYSQPYSELKAMDLPNHPLDPRSRLHCSVSIEVSVDSLRQPNGYQQFQVVGEPDIRLDLISQVGPRDDRNPDGVNHKNVALFRDGDRLVSQGVGNTSAQDEILNQCMRDGEGWMENRQFLSNNFVEHLKSAPGSVVLDLGDRREDVNLTGLGGPRLRDLPGVDETGANTLSFLLAPSVGVGLHETTMQQVLHDPEFKLGQDRPPLSTTITPILLHDGTQALEIEYRGGVPEGLLENHHGTVLHHMDGEPQGRFGFETVVRIRVPVDQLNRGNPGVFDYVHPGRIEGRPIPNQE